MRRAVVFALLAFPVWAAADDSPAEVRAKIAAFERRVAENPGFDWAAHNELRHLYGAIDGKRSLHYSDVILKHSLMDGYILEILSGWRIEKEPRLAVHSLKAAADANGDLKFLAAACRIKAAELAMLQGDGREAAALYDRVAAEPSPGLGPYRDIAVRELERLGSRSVWRALARYSWALAGCFAVIPLLAAWVSYKRREAVRRRLLQSARALGPRRCHPVCYRGEDSRVGWLRPWEGPGVLLVHRGQPILLTPEGERWLGEGCRLSWAGRGAGLSWFSVEGRGRRHEFTAEPGLLPFAGEGPSRRLAALVEEDLKPPLHAQRGEGA